MKYFEYPCGCRFPIIEQTDTDVRIAFDPENIPLDCSQTWDLFCEGNTKGVFQLESRLGQSAAKKVKPRNIEELSDLIAIIRPGCAEAYLEDGKSITHHYIERKHNREPVSYYHPALEKSLSKTKGLIVYQENIIRVVQDIAHFTANEADNLRKACGKKKPELMAELKKLFIEKAKVAKVVNEEEAAAIFGWIEASARYSFNKSHSVGYAVHGYVSAYIKCHFVRPFFTSWSYYSKDKTKPTQEINELVGNARSMNVKISMPDFRRIIEPTWDNSHNASNHFMLRLNTIYVGFTDIKDVGEQELNRTIDCIKQIGRDLGISHKQWTWMHILLFALPMMKSTVAKAFIQVGAFDYLSISRTRMLYEYDILDRFTKKEIEWMKRHYLADATCPSLECLIERIMAAGTGQKEGVGLSSKKRLATAGDILTILKTPPYSMVDSPAWIAGIETSRIGVAITCSKVDDCDSSSANATCQDFIQGFGGYIMMAVQIDAVKEILTKNGKNPGQQMAFLDVSDSTGNISCVVFPEDWETNKGFLSQGNTVLLGGERGKDNAMIVKKVWQI